MSLEHPNSNCLSGFPTAEDPNVSIERERSKLLDNSLDAVVGADEDERVIYWNRHAEIIFGWSQEEALGQNMADLIIPEKFRQAHRNGMRRFITTGQSMIQNKRIEVPAIRRSGEIVMVELTVTSIRSASEPDAPKWRFYSFIRDITDRIVARKAAEDLKTAQLEAERAKIEAEKANQLKSFFLASMSHEIRTPLGAMLGFAELAKEANVSSAQRQNYLDIVIRNGQKLSTLINDILDLSKVEAGYMTLDFSRVTVGSLIDDVVSLLAIKAEEKGLRLEFETHDCENYEIVTDALRVRQVLLNLVGNAIKFTPSGFVKISASRGICAKGKSILFDIIDSGIGIPQGDTERIFDIFAQAEETTSKRFGGTGLGLALSRRLATSLGGDLILLESSEGIGSTFRLQILDQPIERNSVTETAGKQEKLILNPSALAGRKILVVDDSSDNRLLVNEFLTEYGARVEAAENGLIGYQKALRGSYDLVLMDLQMPEMDGYTATQELRSRGYKKPIVALTADAMNEVGRRCLAVGCTAHLLKPINVHLLVSTIADLTAQAHLTPQRVAEL